MSSVHMGNLNTHGLINYVDDRDIPIGKGDRANLPHEQANFRVAHMFVFDQAGNLLLQKIAAGSRSAGKWGSSAAGYVLASEDYAEACQRTVVSELGLPIHQRLVGKTSMPDLGAIKFVALFEGRSEGPFKIDLTQVSEVQFRSLDEIASALEKRPEQFTKTFQHIFSFYLRMRRH